MKTDEQFRKRLTALFGSQNLATLSTHRAGQPYASLVAFYATDDFKYIFFVTPKTTRKYANLTADNRVAVMINSSTNRVADFHQAVSVTAVGKTDDITGKEKKRILKQYLAKHPHLEEFAHAPTCALVRVTVASYYMVRNFQQVMELHLNP